MNNKTNNLVLIGGYGGSKRITEHAAEELGERLNVNDVESYTYSRASNNPERLRISLASAAFASSHSQGALLLSEAGRQSLDREYMFFNAPTPKTRRQLALNGLKIAAQMQLDTIKRPELIVPNAKFSAGYAAELMAHLPANLMPLLSGELSAFDSREEFDHMSREGAKVTSVESTDDYFFPSQALYPGSKTTDSGLHVVTVDGGHNRLLVDTAPMLDEVFYHVYNPNRNL